MLLLHVLVVLTSSLPETVMRSLKTSGMASTLRPPRLWRLHSIKVAPVLLRANSPCKRYRCVDSMYGILFNLIWVSDETQCWSLQRWRIQLSLIPLLRKYSYRFVFH